MQGRSYKIRLSDGFIGRRQAILYQKIYNAQIIRRGNSYMAVVMVSNDDVAERLENFIDYIHRIKPSREMES